jgi:hypothetical protein
VRLWPPCHVCLFIRTPHYGRARTRPLTVHASPLGWPCAPPMPYAPLFLFAPPLPYAPFVSIHAPFALHASFYVLALFFRAHPSHPCVLLPCAPPKCKFHKIVVHSTTWASGSSTTERWLTAGCMSGDHSFYIHSHEHIYGCGCMHFRFHVIYLFIVNACQIGGHIKLLASLYIV